MRRVDDAGQQANRLQRTVDSLVHLFDAEDLSAAERFRIGRELDVAISRLREQRLRATSAPEGSGADGAEMRPGGRWFQPGDGVAPDLMGTVPIPPAAMAAGWIGIVVSGAPTVIRVDRNELLMRYLTYPEIASVDPSSPAQRAGLAPGDTLLAYDGRDVRGTEISMTRLLRPNSTVRVRVRRDGRVRELPVLVAAAPARIRQRRSDEFRVAHDSWGGGVPELAPFPRTPMAPSGPPRIPRQPIAPALPAGTTMPLPPTFEPATGGVAGAQLVTVSDGLRRSLGLEWGVLATTVPGGSPAGESGLREGDVIVRVDAQPVRTVLQVRQLVARAAEDGGRSVRLEVVREKQHRTLTLRW